MMRRDGWRRLGAWLLALLLGLGGLAWGEEAPAYRYEKTGDGMTYDSPTLRCSIEVGQLDGTKVYVSRIWMEDPGRQILKAGSPWHKKLAEAEELAKQLPRAALVVNGSGYVSPLYPDIPENYPGTSADTAERTMRRFWPGTPPRPGASMSSAPSSGTGSAS